VRSVGQRSLGDFRESIKMVFGRVRLARLKKTGSGNSTTLSE
jgi:hypothetical protein